jgi:hypothetical protein
VNKAKKKAAVKRPKRAKTQKLWRPLKAWMPHEWTSMKEAWSRVHDALKSWPLTKRDVKADLRAGRLVGAARVIAPDHGERCIIFERAFWDGIEIAYAWSVSGWERHAREGEAWHFFVRRRELDQRYPGATAATVGKQQPAPQPSAARHKPPGPPPQKDWQLRVAVELGRRQERGEQPTAPEMCQWVLNTLDLEVDEGDIRRLMSRATK